MVPGTAPDKKRRQLHAHQRIQEALVAGAKPLHFARFGPRRHNQADAQQCFQQKASDIGAALANRAHARGQTMLIVLQRPDAGRNRRHAHQKQPRTQRDHDGGAANQKHDVREHAQQAVRRDPLHLGDIIINARDHIAQFGARPETRRKRLQMPVQRQAHVKKHRGRDADVLIARQDVQHESQDRDAEHQPADDQQHAQIVLQQRVVDEKFRDVRLQQAETGGRDAGQQHQHQAGPIGDDETQRAAIAIQRDAPVHCNASLRCDLVPHRFGTLWITPKKKEKRTIKHQNKQHQITTQPKKPPHLTQHHNSRALTTNPPTLTQPQHAHTPTHTNPPTPPHTPHPPPPTPPTPPPPRESCRCRYSATACQKARMPKSEHTDSSTRYSAQNSAR